MDSDNREVKLSVSILCNLYQLVSQHLQREASNLDADATCREWPVSVARNALVNQLC